ncbi:MAG: hypothetical protein WCO89_14405, partial [Syntrophus sp. (in: bacteria)]
ISAGLPAAEKAILSTLAKTLVFGGAAVGALLAAAGGDLGALAFPDPDSGVAAMKQMGVGMAPIVAGTAMQVIALEYLVKKLNTELTHAISKIEMADTGITIKATSATAAGGTNQGINLEVGPPPVLGVPQPSTLSIKMTPGVGPAESITLEKNQGGKMTINSAGVVLEQYNNQGSVTINNANIELKKGAADDKYVKINDNEVQIKHGGARLSLITNQVATLAFGNNSFSVNQQNLILKIGNNILKVQPNGINVEGSLIQLR